MSILFFSLCCYALDPHHNDITTIIYILSKHGKLHFIHTEIIFFSFLIFQRITSGIHLTREWIMNTFDNSTYCEYVNWIEILFLIFFWVAKRRMHSIHYFLVKNESKKKEIILERMKCNRLCSLSLKLVFKSECVCERFTVFVRVYEWV